jgi:hypothetical protein
LPPAMPAPADGSASGRRSPPERERPDLRICEIRCLAAQFRFLAKVVAVRKGGPRTDDFD